MDQPDLGSSILLLFLAAIGITLFVLAVTWLILPWILLPKMDKLVKAQQRTNELLEIIANGP